MDNNLVKQCMALFSGQHRELLGVPYMISYGKDQKIMKDVSALYGAEKTQALIMLFFQELQSDEFLKGAGATVGVFKSQIPKLILKLQTKEKDTQVGRL